MIVGLISSHKGYYYKKFSVEQIFIRLFCDHYGMTQFTKNDVLHNS